MNYDARVWVRPRTTMHTRVELIRCYTGVNDTSVVIHKQTFNRQACAIKKEAPLLLFELSISLCTRTVNRFHGVSHGSGFLKSI